MEWLWISISIIVVFIGILGAILPIIPGPPVAFVALLLLQLKETAPFSEEFLVIMGLIAAGVTFLDYVVPVWGTKKFGGSKAGMTGSLIGLIIGIFVLPSIIVLGPFGIFGIILGPFAGAYVGEKLTGKDSSTAMRAAFGSFIGFLAGTLMKLVYAFICAFFVIKGAFFA